MPQKKKEEIELSSEANGIQRGVYQHFRGDEIQVVGVALHSETLEEVVVYKHVTGERAGEPYQWVRPVKVFLEDVDKDGYKGPRFIFLRDN